MPIYLNPSGFQEKYSLETKKPFVYIINTVVFSGVGNLHFTQLAQSVIFPNEFKERKTSRLRSWRNSCTQLRGRRVGTITDRFSQLWKNKHNL